MQDYSSQILNQLSTLKNVIENVNSNRYEFKSGKRVFQNFQNEVKKYSGSSSGEMTFNNLCLLLIEAGLEMTERKEKKEVTPQKKRRWGIF